MDSREQKSCESLLFLFCCKCFRAYEKDEHDIPSSVLVDLARALHTTPNYLLLGDIEEDDWMDDMIRILEKIRTPEMRRLALNQLKCIVEI